MVDSAPMRHRSLLHLRVVDWIRRFKLIGTGVWLSFAGLLLVLTWLMRLSLGTIPDDLYEGGVAPYDIHAEREYHILDVEATEAARRQAREGVLRVYDFYPGRAGEVAQQIRAAFGTTRKAYEEFLRKARGESVTHREGVEQGIRQALRRLEVSTLRAQWDGSAGFGLRDDQWGALLREEFGMAAQERIVGEVLRLMARPILDSVEPLTTYKERGIVVRTISDPVSTADPPETVWAGKTLVAMSTLDTARKAVRFRGRQGLRVAGNAAVIAGIATAALQPNCTLNEEETRGREAAAIKAVGEVRRRILPRQLIVRAGELYTADHLFQLQGIRREKAAAAGPLKFIGNYLFIGLLLLLTHSFARRYIRKYAPRQIDLLFLAVFLILMVVIVKLGGMMGEILAEARFRAAIPAAAYSYLIPLAAGGMLTRFLLNSETALCFSLVLSALIGLMFPQDPTITAFALVSTMTGAAAMAHADKRSWIIRAGTMAGLMSACAAVGLHLMRAGAITEPTTVGGLAWYAGAAFAGGVLSAIIVLTLTPIAETLFNYTTDIKLLELANLNHPLLRELIIRAPGTYHHSHLVGILAEAAAQAVGANPLLTRVGAYYHDIGKIRKPLYFTENLKEGESRHERLTPHMSALIIGSHVKDGLELARAYKLPEKIAALIPQHHGTNLIGYFFERAKATADPALGSVEEKDFRYPGPKPQSREAGILMLADQGEGAVRALKEKTPARIQQTVEQIINKCFAEGQLSECELTLRNLHEIAKAFTRILLGIYHQRVEYPRESLKLHGKNVSVMEHQTTPEHPVAGAKPPIPSTRH